MFYQPFSVDDCAAAEVAFEFQGGEWQNDLGHRSRVPIRDGNAVRDPVDVLSLSNLTHLLLPQPAPRAIGHDDLDVVLLGDFCETEFTCHGIETYLRETLRIMELGQIAPLHLCRTVITIPPCNLWMDIDDHSVDDVLPNLDMLREQCGTVH
jgi:hypothetical protein